MEFYVRNDDSSSDSSFDDDESENTTIFDDPREPRRYVEYSTGYTDLFDMENESEWSLNFEEEYVDPPPMYFEDDRGAHITDRGSPVYHETFLVRKTKLMQMLMANKDDNIDGMRKKTFLRRFNSKITNFLYLQKDQGMCIIIYGESIRVIVDVENRTLRFGSNHRCLSLLSVPDNVSIDTDDIASQCVPGKTYLFLPQIKNQRFPGKLSICFSNLVDKIEKLVLGV